MAEGALRHFAKLKCLPIGKKVSDDSGLNYEPTATNKGKWSCRLAIDGKSHEMRIGTYPEISPFSAHRVPLSKPALELVESVIRKHNQPFIFPSTKAETSLSNGATHHLNSRWNFQDCLSCGVHLGAMRPDISGRRLTVVQDKCLSFKHVLFCTCKNYKKELWK